VIKFPLDVRYKPYLGLGAAVGDDATVESPTFGYPNVKVVNGEAIRTPVEDGLGIVLVDLEDGSALFTRADSGVTRRATYANEAGEGYKDYKHTVKRVNINRITKQQAKDGGPNFFEGFFANADNRLGEDYDGIDTVRFREEILPVKYTGNTAKLVDGIVGAVSSWTDATTDKPVYYAGLGIHQFWYSGVDGTTFYPLQPVVPTNVGTYDVWASFERGLNFEAVPSKEASVIYIGTVEVTQGDNESVFGKKGGVYNEVVYLEAGKPGQVTVPVSLPNVTNFGAKYELAGEPSGSAVDLSLVQTPAPAIKDSILTFRVNTATAQVGQDITFQVNIVNTGTVKNLIESGMFITVRAAFMSREQMEEAVPSYITVNYRDSLLTGLIKGTKYTINGTELPALTLDTVRINAGSSARRSPLSRKRRPSGGTTASRTRW